MDIKKEYERWLANATELGRTWAVKNASTA